MGFIHAVGTVEVIGNHLGDPVAVAAEHDRITEDQVIPWYRATVEFDRARKAQLDAAIDGTPAPQPTGPAELLQQASATAMLYDADIFRAMMEIITMQALPEQVFARPAFARRVIAAAEGREAFVPPGPSRAQLLGRAGVSTGEGRIIEVNGVPLYVEDHGSGTPVLLIHGWPDSCYLWRHQIRFLTGHGFRAIAPDLRGFGRSGRPAAVADYALANAVGDMAGLLDALGVASAHLVGHDWGAAVGWFTAMLQPNRVNKLVVLSVGHPRAPRTLRQDEMAWYQLFFQFEGIAEATLALRRLGLAAPVQPRRRRPGTLPATTCPAPARSPLH